MTKRLALDEAVYSLETVQKAAYRFIDRLTILISREDGQIVCELSPVADRTQAFQSVIDDFKRELLDQQLRAQIKAETEAVRNLILALAFSRSGLQE